MHGLAAADLRLDSLVSHFDERGELVDRKEVPYAVAELLRHITGVVAERLGSITRLPAAVSVLKRLRQLTGTKETKIVITTGKLTPKIRETAMSAGASSCLQKPFSLESLMTELDLEEVTKWPLANQRTLRGG